MFIEFYIIMCWMVSAGCMVYVYFQWKKKRNEGK